LLGHGATRVPKGFGSTSAARRPRTMASDGSAARKSAHGDPGARMNRIRLLVRMAGIVDGAVA
jgi:hypothetical protein